MTTQLTEGQMKVLMSPLNPARVQSRRQGGANLSYLAAYDVKATLIRLFGFGGFSSEVTESDIVEIIRTDAKDASGKDYVKIVALAKVTVRLTIHQTGAVYVESACASQTGRDVGEVADFAVKTAASDALKRCAINLGTQFGLGLYDGGSTSEVVSVVFAPGQEWTRDQAATPEQSETLAKSLGQK